MLTLEVLNNQIDGIRDYLKTSGIEIPDNLKTRDTREPGRLEKQKREILLFRLLKRYWKEQKQRITERLRFTLPLKSNYLPDSFWQDENDRAITELTKLLANSAQNGIALFGQMEKIGLDYTLSNKEANEWAKKYSYELISGINQVTREAVSTEIQHFIDIQGYTIGDIISNLPYSEERGMKIAVTEVTRAYAQGNQLAGEQLQAEFPNVRVIKIWFTNNDDRVCPICSPLDGKRVQIDKEFTSGIDLPPAHINCRCWTSTTTELK